MIWKILHTNVTKCGMSVKSQCAKCDEPLQNKTITVDSGDEVQVSFLPTM